MTGHRHRPPSRSQALRVSRKNRIGIWTTAAALCLAGATAAFAQGQETTGHRSYWLPETVSTFGQKVDSLFYYILYLTVIINIAVFIALVAFLIKYRHKPGRHATFIHGNNRLETVWTLVPTIILALTAVFSETSWSEIKKFSPSVAKEQGVIEVDVVAQQFLWNFHYPGKDGNLGARKRELINKNGSPDEQIGLDRSGDGKDDIVTNVMYIPVGRKVYVHLTSRDVIHSFYLPNFRVKQDAVPGLNSRIWLEAQKTSGEVIGMNADGTPKPFDIVCAELCGQGHYKMRGQMYVVSEDEFQAFLTKEAANLPAGDDAGY
jgi:cytochrome c oxidase subunit 2